MTLALQVQKQMQKAELSKHDIFCVSCLNECGTDSSQVPVKDIVYISHPCLVNLFVNKLHWIRSILGLISPKKP